MSEEVNIISADETIWETDKAQMLRTVKNVSSQDGPIKSQIILKGISKKKWKLLFKKVIYCGGGVNCSKLLHDVHLRTMRMKTEARSYI